MAAEKIAATAEKCETLLATKFAADERAKGATRKQEKLQSELGRQQKLLAGEGARLDAAIAARVAVLQKRAAEAQQQVVMLKGMVRSRQHVVAGKEIDVSRLEQARLRCVPQSPTAHPSPDRRDHDVLPILPRAVRWCIANRPSATASPSDSTASRRSKRRRHPAPCRTVVRRACPPSPRLRESRAQVVRTRKFRRFGVTLVADPDYVLALYPYPYPYHTR